MTVFPIGAKVGADTRAFVGSMGAATGGLRAFAGAAGLASGALGVFAGAAVMGAAVGAAREYQSELVKLNTLVGIQTEQIEEWDGAIRGIAEATGQAPADLARAMFAITSGGARGAEALSILEQAAKAGAIGLGDMTAIGRTATAMMQAFGDRGLTAERAIDILTATVREGNLEASSLAGSFSRVLGPAAALGASVEDLGAFMATFTRLGGSTEQAATGLLNVFNLLIKPPSDARAAMEEMGVSIETLRQTIREDGLTAALVQLNDALGGNIDALGAVIPNSRALIGVLNTVGLQEEEFVRISKDMTNVLGEVNSSFETWGDTADATFKKFTAELQTTAIAIGELLLPPLTLLLQALQPLVELIRFSAEGWGLMAGAIKEAALEALDIITPMTAIEEKAREMNDSVANLRNRFGELSDEQLGIIQSQLAARLDTLNRAVAQGGENAEQAAAQRERELLMLRDVNAELTRRARGEEEVTDAVVESTTAQRELTEAELERLESIDQLIAGLEMQRLEEEEGALAVLMHQLETLEASDATKQYAQSLFIAIQEAREMARAEAEAARETERAAAARKREAERLRRERRQAADRAAEAAERAAERADLARIQEEMREITRISTDMAETIAGAFEDMVTGTKSVADAFGDMVTEILRQVQRLLIQRAIVEPLVNALVGQFGPGVGSGPSASDFTARSQELSRQLPSGPGNVVSTSSGGVSGFQLQGSQQTIVVQPVVQFSPNLIDGRSGQRFLQENAGTIVGMVGDAVDRSTDFASKMRGGL